MSFEFCLVYFFPKKNGGIQLLAFVQLLCECQLTFICYNYSEVSKTEGRVGHTTNVVIGGTVTDDATNEWLALDQKV